MGSVVNSSLVDRLRDDMVVEAKPNTLLSLEELELRPFGWWSLADEFLRWNMRRIFSHGLNRFRLLSRINKNKNNNNQNRNQGNWKVCAILSF